MIRLAAVLLLCSLATPAEAGPVAAAIGGLLTAVKGFAALNALTAFLVKTAVSIGLSALARALAPKPRPAGISTETTTTGGTTPQKFILGRYATAGQLIAPPMSYGAAGKTPRAYLVYPLAVSCLPGVTLERVVINDDYVTLGAAGANWGRPATGDLAGYAWIDWRDGSQTAAHADLLAAFAADPDRPWSADMVGPGTAYAICRFKYNREVFNGLPALRFECLGIPLYDPRQDSTVGGTGAQRWSTPSTWTQTSNPAVMIYNILRGIALPDGQVWGGGIAAEDLPLASWFAAMNECDIAIPLAAGGTEPQFRAGLEIALDDEPASVIEELLKACSGQIAEFGGVWKMRCGPVAMPVLTLSDDDILVSEEADYEPFPGLSATWNGITATYPEPANLWESKEAPALYNATWEAEDGGRRLVADLRLPAVSWPLQVQRLMSGLIADDRRFRRHRLSLPPEAALLEPLDAISWTSVRNGYTAKVFEVTGLVDALGTLVQSVQLRERDAGDYSWSTAMERATTLVGAGTTPTAAQSVPGWAAAAAVISDGSADRRPAIDLSWDADGAEDARGLQWEVRLAGSGAAILSGTQSQIATGTLRIAEGVLAATAYELRARLIVDRPVSWTAWTAVTTGDTRLALVDLNGQRAQTIVVGPVTIPNATTNVIATLAIGAMDNGSIWKRGLVFEARGFTGNAWTLTLQRRRKYAGTWSAWEDLTSWTLDFSATAWGMYADTGTLGGAWEDFEYRVVSASATSRTDALRNLYLTVVNVAK